MSAHVRSRKYSARDWLVALFLVIALVLGGGGSPNPATELVLELLFVPVAILWLWLPGDLTKPEASANPLVIALAILVLIVPTLQLIPLPASLWTALPGRENEVAALSLVSEQHSWRPFSMSPARTLASLLSTVPAAFCLIAVARLDTPGRRLVMATIAAMAVISAALGAAQLIMRSSHLNLYEQFSRGWITGFQANRNAEADVLLIGFLALAVLGAPYLAGMRRKFHLSLDRRMFTVLVTGLGLLLLLATVMTGSRAGLVLAVGSLLAAFVVVAVEIRSAGVGKVLVGAWVLPLTALVAIIVYAGISQNTAVGRVAQRFSDVENPRAEVWQDARYILAESWPAGVGIGGFVPAIAAAERLEAVDEGVPNRAHDDYLEIGLEAGFLGYGIVAIAAIICLTMTWIKWRDDPTTRGQALFGTTVLSLIAFHSVVDYPLRSMAVACLAGVAGGMLARTRAPAS
jgi:hypothetical protein